MPGPFPSCPYSPKCLEGVFCEVRLWGVHEGGIMLTMQTVAR
jgi:hypothetical protein